MADVSYKRCKAYVFLCSIPTWEAAVQHKPKFWNSVMWELRLNSYFLFNTFKSVTTQMEQEIIWDSPLFLLQLQVLSLLHLSLPLLFLPFAWLLWQDTSHCPLPSSLKAFSKSFMTTLITSHTLNFCFASKQFQHFSLVLSIKRVSLQALHRIFTMATHLPLQNAPFYNAHKKLDND